MVARTVNIGRCLFRFDNFAHWVGTAKAQFKRHGVTGSQTLCIDADGAVCGWGLHFREARYPIDVYALRPEQPALETSAKRECER